MTEKLLCFFVKIRMVIHKIIRNIAATMPEIEPSQSRSTGKVEITQSACEQSQNFILLIV